MSYKMIPHSVEAFRFGHDPLPSWASESQKIMLCTADDDDEELLEIEYARGVGLARKGDWVVKGPLGLAAFADSAFKQLYEQPSCCWEFVSETGDERLERMPVHNGWLYRATFISETPSVSLCHVPWT